MTEGCKGRPGNNGQRSYRSVRISHRTVRDPQIRNIRSNTGHPSPPRHPGRTSASTPFRRRPHARKPSGTARSALLHPGYRSGRARHSPVRSHQWTGTAGQRRRVPPRPAERAYDAVGCAPADRAGPVPLRAGGAGGAQRPPDPSAARRAAAAGRSGGREAAAAPRGGRAAPAVAVRGADRPPAPRGTGEPAPPWGAARMRPQELEAGYAGPKGPAVVRQAERRRRVSAKARGPVRGHTSRERAPCARRLMARAC